MASRLLHFIFLPFLPAVFFLAKQLDKKGFQWLAKVILISVQSAFANRASPNFELGTFLMTHHEPKEAVQYISLAHQLKPKDFNIKCQLASTYWDTGDFDTAIDLTESLMAEKSVKHPVFLRCKAKLLSHNEDDELANTTLKQAVIADNHYAAAFYDLGLLAKQIFQQSEQAKDYFTRTLAIDSNHLNAHTELAILLFNSKAYEDAIPHFLVAVKDNQTNFTLFSGLIRCCIRLRQFNEGLVFCDQANEYFPQQPELFFFYGECLRGINAHQQSIAALNKAISLVADYADAYASLAFTYRNSGQFEEALTSINNAIQINPDKSDYFNAKGLVYEELMALEDALGCFNKAYELQPDYYAVVWHRALVKLLLFDFETGWQDYVFRFQSGAQEKRDFPFQEWKGESLKGKKLLIYAEQGLGDELMFASCITDIMGQAESCIVDCCAKLENLFQRSFPTVMIKTSNQDEDCQWINEVDVDYQVSVADLPLHFRTSWEQFPRQPYLTASNEKTQHWQKKLDALEGTLNVGISWVGGAHKTRRHWRSFALQTLLPILSQQGINFISLQYTDCVDEIDHFEAKNGIKVHHWQQAIDDYDETAALVNALDLVISVQTAIIHLAGSLGKPAWVMVRNNPEWRYGANGETMPWYGSIKLFRQQQFGDWVAVVEQVSEALKQLIKN